MEKTNYNYTQTILIVDDNPKNLQVLGKFLKDEGFKIEFAVNGENALEWVNQQDFDLILLDIMMPGMSGYDVCEKLKKDGNSKDIPVIFLTAQTDTESIVKGFDLGATDYVTKPFNRKELLARVSTQLKIRKAQQEISHYLRELEMNNKLITYSIKYARHIQNTIIQLNSNIKKVIPEHFIFYRPKDIVSGDFYWFDTVKNYLIGAIMDCTGHGVPGAMMSMMGITLLNEIVRVKRIIKPNQVLNHLRDKIIESLGQKGIAEEVRDGMDGSVMLLDLKNKKIEFSGAFSSLYLLRKNELIKIKGDRMPVAFPKMRDFTNHELSLVKGDMLYFFTDGYIDQFGGPEDKKFNHNLFCELLLKIQGRKVMEQKEMLARVFNEWKGDSDQIDDVTVLGIRI
jgi:sigma-B regulation protein RsbU (phosphoserine phosphatase)